MSKEVRERIRPWTQVPIPRRRREKTFVAVPTVDTYRKQMEHVQTAYQRLRLDGSCHRTPTSLSSSSSSLSPSASPSPPTAFPSVLPYRMTRSHTFAASPRHFRGAAAWHPLLEFSSLAGPSSSSRRSSVLSSDSHKHEESSSRVPSPKQQRRRKHSTVTAPPLLTNDGFSSARAVLPDRTFQPAVVPAPVRRVSWVDEGQRFDSLHTEENGHRVPSPPHPSHPLLALFTLTREETKILTHPDNKHNKTHASDHPAVSKKKKKNEEDASSSGVSSRSSSCHDLKDNGVVLDPHALSDSGNRSAHVQRESEINSVHPLQDKGGEGRQTWENGESPREETGLKPQELVPAQPVLKSVDAKASQPKKRKSLVYSDHLSSLDEPMDILQLCEHLKTRGLGDPVMSLHSHKGPQTNALPPGVKARLLPRNPSTREKIKGRARLDQELANMRAVAFCEQQHSKVFRTASADLKDRDVRLLEEEERENVHKDLNEVDKARRLAQEVPDDDNDDDVSSMVCSPLSREELFCRIEAWADEVHDALHRGDQAGEGQGSRTLGHQGQGHDVKRV